MRRRGGRVPKAMELVLFRLLKDLQVPRHITVLACSGFLEGSIVELLDTTAPASFECQLPRANRLMSSSVKPWVRKVSHTGWDLRRALSSDEVRTW